LALPNILSLSLLASLQYGLVASAFASTLESFPIDEDYFERESDSVPIAGALVVSVISIGEEPVQKSPSIVALVPGNWSNKAVCVRGHSRDGKYESSRDHKIPAELEGNDLVNFIYPTKTTRSEKRLETADDETFGLTIALGECVKEQPVYLAPFLNTKATSYQRTIKLAINSIGADSAWVFVGDQADAPAVECQKVAESNKRGFDFYCLLDSNVIGDQSRVNLEINVSTNNIADPPVSIAIERAQ